MKKLYFIFILALFIPTSGIHAQNWQVQGGASANIQIDRAGATIGTVNTVSNNGSVSGVSRNTSSRGMTLKDIMYNIMGYFDTILILLIGAAMIMFVWYIIQYFIKADAERKEAAPYVMYSVTGFFIILSLWGLVRVMRNTFNLPTDRPTDNWSEFIGLFPNK